MTKTKYIKIRFYITCKNKTVGWIDWPVNLKKEWNECLNPMLLKDQVILFFKTYCREHRDSELDINFKPKKIKSYKKWKY